MSDADKLTRKLVAAGADNLLLEPLGGTSRLFAQDNDGNTVAALMGLKG